MRAATAAKKAGLTDGGIAKVAACVVLYILTNFVNDPARGDPSGRVEIGGLGGRRMGRHSGELAFTDSVERFWASDGSQARGGRDTLREDLAAVPALCRSIRMAELEARLKEAGLA